MRTILVLTSLVGLAYAGVGILSPSEEADALQLFEMLCSGYGAEGQDIGGTRVYCKRGPGERTETTNHRVNVPGSSGRSQTIFVQPPSIRYRHTVDIVSQGGQGQQTKIYVLPQQATHTITPNIQQNPGSQVKPVVYFLKGGSSSSSSFINSGYGPPPPQGYGPPPQPQAQLLSGYSPPPPPPPTQPPQGYSTPSQPPPNYGPPPAQPLSGYESPPSSQPPQGYSSPNQPPTNYGPPPAQPPPTYGPPTAPPSPSYGPPTPPSQPPQGYSSPPPPPTQPPPTYGAPPPQPPSSYGPPTAPPPPANEPVGGYGSSNSGGYDGSGSRFARSNIKKSKCKNARLCSFVDKLVASVFPESTA